MARRAVEIDPKRRGPARPQDVPAEVRRALSLGEIASVNLAEGLAVEQHTLLVSACPEVGEPAVERLLAAEGEGVTRRMRLAAELLLERFGPGKIQQLSGHRSDTVRGWACLMVGLVPGWSVDRRLEAIRPLADDGHFGVREWAWMGVRQSVIDELGRALVLLEPWTRSHRPWLRRFAVEATRPRGVWCPHIEALKRDPGPGLALLEPVRADGEKYVQDSAANWLNDAGKTQAGWVLSVTERWLAESPVPATQRIVARARRNLTPG
jgi:3-methyladenine DNA glycosylase AlkC